MKKIKDNNGFALVLSLLLMLVLSILGVTLVFLATKETKFVVYQKKSDAAFYLADGGLSRAIHKLRINSTFSGETDVPLGEGVFTTQVTSLGESKYKIYSTGYIPDSENPKTKRKIKAIVKRSIEGFNYIILVEEKAKLNKHNATQAPYIKGDIYSNGKIDLIGDGTTVDGNVTAVGKLKKQGSIIITGEERDEDSAPPPEEVPFPAVNYSYFMQLASDNGTYFEEEADFQTYLNNNYDPVTKTYNLSGVIYCEEKIEIDVANDRKIVVNGTLVTEGKFEVKNFDTYNHAYTNSRPAIIGQEGVKFKKGPVSISGLVYSDEGEIYIKTESSNETVYIYGSETAEKIHNDTYFRLVYDPNMQSLDGFQGGEIRILEWTETTP